MTEHSHNRLTSTRCPSPPSPFPFTPRHRIFGLDDKHEQGQNPEGSGSRRRGAPRPKRPAPGRSGYGRPAFGGYGPFGYDAAAILGRSEPDAAQREGRSSRGGTSDLGARLTARVAWEHAGTPRAAEAQLPGGPDVDCPEITKEEAVAILAADPAAGNG